MDAVRFDSLARALDARSRRRVLGSLSGVALGAFGSVFSLPRAEAKNRHKKGNNNKRDDNPNNDCPTCETCSTCPEPPAEPTCNQVCGSCSFCFTQASGTLLCNAHLNFFYGSDCGSGRVCSSDNDCVNSTVAGVSTPYCVTHIAGYNSTSYSFDSPAPICGGVGRCAQLGESCSA